MYIYFNYVHLTIGFAEEIFGCEEVVKKKKVMPTMQYNFWPRTGVNLPCEICLTLLK